ncbi:HNH endonuclease [Promicromonospora soli]|nr:HNH endonuclease signature motif containing protein [Promicromonospora soli]
MSEVSEGSGVLTVVERSLRAVTAVDATQTRLSVSTTAPGPVLSWGVLPLDDKGALPLALVTWPGHPATTGLVGTRSLDGLPVGAGLVEVLARVEVADTDDAVLLDVAARWQEVVSWATAMQSRALGEIGRRRGWTEEHNAAAAEISARLRVPQGEANKHMARGAGLAEHPQVMNALHEGVIDVVKADILLRSGNPLTTEEREEAITLYLPQAPEHTRRWLQDKMNAFATRLKGSTETTKHAMTRRAVFLDPADNTMAWLSAHLPAADAAAVWDAVEQAAHALRRASGATRTLAQARADALVALATGRIVVPPQPECAPRSNEGSAEPSGSTEGVDAPQLPRTTVPATGCTCGGCTCGGAAVRIIPVKPQIRITVPASMLLGLDNTPGHLDGYGPIPADTAALLATDATWQRLITDPLTGILTDYSTTAYQPGKILRQAVTARDQTCCFLQCDRPAHWADLDHITPYDHGAEPSDKSTGGPGQTRAQNLQPLCRAHHLAKTHHGWTPVRDPDTGITTWTAPTGHAYTRPGTQIGTTNPAAERPDTGHSRSAHTSNDITSLTEDTRARLGQLPPGDRPVTPDHVAKDPSSTRRPARNHSTEPPTTGRQFRRSPDEPPF